MFLFAVALASPAALIVATLDVFAETQVTLPVRFWVLPSLKVPVAVNCCVKPFGNGEDSRVLLSMDCSRCGNYRQRVALPLTAPRSCADR